MKGPTKTADFTTPSKTRSGSSTLTHERGDSALMVNLLILRRHTSFVRAVILIILFNLEAGPGSGQSLIVEADRCYPRLTGPAVYRCPQHKTLHPAQVQSMLAYFKTLML